jgi:MarR family transcriptional regulator for hemolysin
MGEDRSGPLLRISLLARQMRAHFDRRARTLGVTRAQWLTLAAVRDHPGASQREIAELLEVGDVTAGRLIARLCEDGWLDRRADRADRRANRLFLGAEALAILEQLDTLANAEQARSLAGFSADERERLLSFLDRISRNLAQPGRD